MIPQVTGVISLLMTLNPSRPGRLTITQGEGCCLNCVSTGAHAITGKPSTRLLRFEKRCASISVALSLLDHRAKSSRSYIHKAEEYRCVHVPTYIAYAALYKFKYFTCPQVAELSYSLGDILESDFTTNIYTHTDM